MPLADLTDNERAVVYDCLKCVADAVAHNWECRALLPLRDTQLQRVLDGWATADDSNPVVNLAIHSSMRILLAFADGGISQLHMPHDRAQVAAVFEKWSTQSAV